VDCLKITDLKTVPVAVPFNQFDTYEPVTMWYGTRYASRHAIVFIETDEGITGVGACRDTSMDLVLDIYKNGLLGIDPFDIRNIEALTMGLRAGRRPDAAAAIDHACWDIIGKACDKPVYKLIGGRVHDKFRCEFWECTKSPGNVFSDVSKAIELGWRAFKIKIGVDPKTDLSIVAAAREAAGDGIELGFDVNDSYTVPIAIRTIKKMEKYDPAYIEQPIASWDIRGLAEVKRHIDVPILCHSFNVTLNKKSTLELIQANAADMLNINPDYMGSLLYCQEIAAIAEAGGIIPKIQSSCAELGPANAGLLHLAASTPAFTVTGQNSNHHLEKSGDVIKKPFKTVNGCLKVPEEPGLGIEIDKDKLEKWNGAWVSGKYAHEPGLPRSDIYLNSFASSYSRMRERLF
jgi:L-alanine-DL-glutamate epimerase-like enolase superfamily enzyme